MLIPKGLRRGTKLWFSDKEYVTVGHRNYNANYLPTGAVICTLRRSDKRESLMVYEPDGRERFEETPPICRVPKRRAAKEHKDVPFNASQLTDPEWLRFIAREDKERMPLRYYRRLFKIARRVARLDEMERALKTDRKVFRAVLGKPLATLRKKRKGALRIGAGSLVSRA